MFTRSFSKNREREREINISGHRRGAPAIWGTVYTTSVVTPSNIPRVCRRHSYPVARRRTAEAVAVHLFCVRQGGSGQSKGACLAPPAWTCARQLQLFPPLEPHPRLTHTPYPSQRLPSQRLLDHGRIWGQVSGDCELMSVLFPLVGLSFCARWCWSFIL